MCFFRPEGGTYCGFVKILLSLRLGPTLWGWRLCDYRYGRKSEEGAKISTIPYRAPQLIATPGIDSFTPIPGIIGYTAAWKEADFTTYTAGNAAKLVNPTGGLASSPGPVLGSTLLITATASAGAPGGSYYIVATYTATGQESQPSQETLFSVPAGFVPQVEVVSAGAPGAATNFAAYAALFAGGEALQQASKTTTALDATFNIPNALINQFGFQRSATGDSAKLAIAMHDSAEIYVKGYGGGNTAGGPNNILGVAGNPSPFASNFQTQGLFYGLRNGQLVEMSLVQPFSFGLLGAAVGLTLDATTNQFVADTGQTQIGTIEYFVDGAPSDVGGEFATGTRVAVSILPSVAF